MQEVTKSDSFVVVDSIILLKLSFEKMSEQMPKDVIVLLSRIMNLLLMKFFYHHFELLFLRNLQDLFLYFLHIYVDLPELKDFCFRFSNVS